MLAELAAGEQHLQTGEEAFDRLNPNTAPQGGHQVLEVAAQNESTTFDEHAGSM